MVQREEGQEVDRSLEDVEPAAGPCVVEAVPGVASAYVPLEAGTAAVKAPFVGVTGNAVLIQSDEHGVVVVIAALRRLPALIDESGMDKGIQYIPADEALLEQVGVNTAHGAVSRRQLEFSFLLLLGRSGADFTLFAI